jgi:hypothetical protein
VLNLISNTINNGFNQNKSISQTGLAGKTNPYECPYARFKAFRRLSGGQ